MTSHTKQNLIGSAMLLLAAFIWGTTFVAQSLGMDYVEPFTYNCVRSFVGGIVILPAVFIFRKIKPAAERGDIKTSLIGGVFCGIALFAASSLQQLGIARTTAGKAGFITALYIIIVPIIGFFMKKKTPWRIWVCAAAAIVGFYLLCIKSDFSLAEGDLFVLMCAVIFSVHILLVDRFNAKNADGVLMSCVQFFVAGVLSLPVMFIFEKPSVGAIIDARLAILYAGVLSSGVAFTLQILGQRRTQPTVATMIMSLESVFAALSGWLILNERLSAREFSGCALVFAAVIAAQLPEKKRKTERSAGNKS